jgi:hypothetical protein
MTEEELLRHYAQLDIRMCLYFMGLASYNKRLKEIPLNMVQEEFDNIIFSTISS